MSENEVKEWFDELVEYVGYDNATYTVEVCGMKHPYDDISIDRFITLVDKYKNKSEAVKKRKKRKPINIKDRYKIYERDEYKCVICGSKKDVEIDHILPVAKGGDSVLTNYITLCAKCNLKKKDKSFLEFMCNKYKMLTMSHANDLIDYIFESEAGKPTIKAKESM